jgi:hypothetical protein
MAGGYIYRSFADLQALGQRVVDKAAEVVLWQDDSYSQAQQGSIDDFTKAQTPGMDTGNPHYAAPDAGHPTRWSRPATGSSPMTGGASAGRARP